MNSSSLQQIAKEFVGKAIADRVSSGDCIGLGTGSTATCAIKAIGERIRAKEIVDISGIPTSERTKKLAISLGIEIIEKSALSGEKLTWAFDGADEIVLSSGWAIKGGGGAMTSEKAVAKMSKKLILIVDESKLSDVLGTNWMVPIEVFKGHNEEVFRDLKNIGAMEYTQRMNAEGPYITEHGNHIIDVKFNKIHQHLEKAINSINSNIVENGLFTDPGQSLASEILVARNNGSVDSIQIKN